MSRGDRKAIIVRDRPDLSLSRQCRLLPIARSSVYYAAKGESPANLALMRRIDELFLKYPFYGSRQMTQHLSWRFGNQVRPSPGLITAVEAVDGSSAQRSAGEDQLATRCEHRIYRLPSQEADNRNAATRSGAPTSPTFR